MIFISAGHNSKAPVKPDPGAVANGYKEGDIAIQFRDLVCAELRKLNVRYVTDYDYETLAQYLTRIKTGSGSVVIEYHLDAAASTTATGTTALVQSDADRLDKAFAKELSDSTAQILGIKNRGVLSEAQSHRGRLGLMREDGIVCLLELCFITNKADLTALFAGMQKLAKKHAAIIAHYEKLVD